jgi:hypothetical protein
MKSYACKVDGHVSPTAANWEHFFLGRQSATADRFLNLMVPHEPTMMTLPQSPEPTAPKEVVDGELVFCDQRY